MSPPGLALMIPGNVSASSRRGHQKLWKLENEDLERHMRRRTQSWSERWLGGGRAGRGPLLHRVKGQRACQKTAEHSSRSCSCKLTWGWASSLGAAAPTDSDAHITGPKWDEITWGVTAGPSARPRLLFQPVTPPGALSSWRSPWGNTGHREVKTRTDSAALQGNKTLLSKERDVLGDQRPPAVPCPTSTTHCSVRELKGPGDCAVSAQHADQVRKSQTEPAASLKSQSNHCLLWLQIRRIQGQTLRGLPSEETPGPKKHPGL